MRQDTQGKAKIVCTLGPSTVGVERLTALIEAGMDIVRLNFSHGTHEDHRRSLDDVRVASERSGACLTVLQDLQGPKIRVGELSQPYVELVAGRETTITTEAIAGTAERIPTSFKNLPGDVSTGEMILLDDGRLRLRVLEVRGNDVRCTVVTGGRLSPHKGINLPGVPVSAPAFTEKDLRDLDFGIAQGVDYVALSFVRRAEDVRQLRKEIANRVADDMPPLIIAKIEKPQAVEDIDNIIAEADGIMVARGDLGVEMPPEDVPLLQKMIIRKCNDAGKPVIVATQMLESMIVNPAPTRAETSDVANAVLDGCDAVMLSGETSVGKYPVEAVEIMNRIILKVESKQHGLQRVLARPLGTAEGRHDALGRAACILAEQMDAAAIVAVTHSGQTARVLSRYRPDPPIVAITLDPKVHRQLNIAWGVRGIVIKSLDPNSDKALEEVQKRLLDMGIVRAGEYVVILAGQPLFARGSTNFIKVERVK
jgi:pyruvate kinase